MPINYSNDVENARLQVVEDLLAGKTLVASTGSGTPGKLVIGDSTLAGSGSTGILVEFDLSANPFSIAGGVMTLLDVPITGTAIADGVATKAQLRSNAGVVIASNLRVGTAGTDIIIPNTSIKEDQEVVLTSATITHG